MADSIAIVESKRNKGAAEAAIQDWLDNNSVTSIDHTNVERRGKDKLLHYIWYTA